MLMNEMMNTRIMASFLDEKTPLKGYLTESSFYNIAKMIIEENGEENAESSFEYFSLNLLAEESHCSIDDLMSISDQMDNWGTVVHAMIKRGTIVKIIEDENMIDSLVVMELNGTPVVFNCLDGIVGMIIHKHNVEQFVKDANSSR